MALDAHTHLDLAAFDADRDEVVARAHAAGVRGWVIAGADPDRWDDVQHTAAATGGVWVLGVHPWWIPDLDDPALARHLEALAARPTPHGIGETGLDHARARTLAARTRQADAFVAHLDLARDRDVPVVLHDVRATTTLLGLLSAHPLPGAGGMVHAWQAPAEHVRRAVDLGLHLSFGSGLFRSRHAQAAIRHVPLDRLLIETDAPDQPVTTGSRGEPADLLAIAAQAAALRDEPLAAILEATEANCVRLFPALANRGPQG